MGQRVEIAVDRGNRSAEFARNGAKLAGQRTEADPRAAAESRDNFEIAARTISPDDMREGLIHSIQHNVEIDEPDAAAAPIDPRQHRISLGPDDQSSDKTVDTLTEEELLHALKKLSPEDPTKDGTDRSRFPQRDS